MAATNVWGYWAGQWGMPGRRPFMYLHSKVPDQAISWSLRAYPDGALQWGDNAWNFTKDAPHSAAEDMLFHAAVRATKPRATSNLVASEVLIGVCASRSTFQNCTYIGRTSGDDRLSLVPADRALTFKWSCVPCESRPLNGSAAVMIAGLIGLALLPLGIHRMWRSRRKLPPPVQWPPAPRSSLAWLLLFISWALVIIGVTPSVLWYVGHWWASQASLPLPLVILGATGMQMCLRQDDPLTLIRLISLLNVIARLTVLWFAIYEASLSASRLSATREADDYPLSTPYGQFAVEGVHLIGNVVLQFLMVGFCVSQKPLWCPGAERRTLQPLRWLWRTTRFNFFASAIVLFLMSLATIVIGFFHRASAYPSEVERGTGLLALYLTMGTGLLISFLVTGEVSRLRIHMRNITMPSPTLIPPWRPSPTPSLLSDPSMSPPSLVGASGIEITEATSPASPDVCDEANLATAPHGTMVNAPRPVAPLQERLAHSGSLNASIASLSHKDLFGFDGVSAWSDVDVSSWRDPHGHFDTLRLLSRIGHGGYSSVFVAELDAPLISSASASVVTGAGSSAGAPPGHSGGSLVAAKVFLRGAYQDAAEMSRLQTELDLALSLSNPYVVRTLGMTLLRGPYPVLVMDLMAGSLEDLLYTRTGTHTMPGALKRRLLLEVALGLEFLHSMGVVHRDIKPANVLLDNKIHAKIGDFGIATRFGMESLTASVGTARYMAPEVVFGPYDERADIFAFGMLTWATLHEAVPFGKISPVAAIMRIQCGARPPQTVPDDLANLVPLIEMCWQETPQERPQRMSAIIETLEDCGAVLSDSSGVVDG